MKTLTKDQVKRLPPADQEAYGLAVARELQHRLNLIARVRPSRWLHAFDGVAFMAIIGAAVWVGWPYSVPIALLFSYLQWHTTRINRRIDALAELVEPEVLQSAGEASANADPNV